MYIVAVVKGKWTLEAIPPGSPSSYAQYGVAASRVCHRQQQCNASAGEIPSYPMQIAQRPSLRSSSLSRTQAKSLSRRQIRRRTILWMKTNLICAIARTARQSQRRTKIRKMTRNLLLHIPRQVTRCSGGSQTQEQTLSQHPPETGTVRAHQNWTNSLVERLRHVPLNDLNPGTIEPADHQVAFHTHNARGKFHFRRWR